MPWMAKGQLLLDLILTGKNARSAENNREFGTLPFLLKVFPVPYLLHHSQAEPRSFVEDF
ncbi:hypothetical protein H6G00_02845 [Leptolyngbya sp. FACHB-541]|uniref:hypothetical protein n=1 Tax=Leptolyngbya sp. FACHB-541 TaxID=2692810 RepID=UPI001682F0BB|nr:hypothetical protein [Leptolyngbya sp. FACHB-541]MBD1869338.1 hypothetical protein [Cyanobacteria bacterium FACHB-471]MBD1995566.1 hypothetical protein [Leptolyngbya sp. FACHB-541]